MPTKVIKKVGAGIQDLAVGLGQASQTRGGKTVDVDKIAVVFIVNDLAQLRSLNTDCTYAAIQNGKSLVHYYYNSSSTQVVDDDQVILPDSNVGRWLKINPLEYTGQTIGATTTVLKDSAGDAIEIDQASIIAVEVLIAAVTDDWAESAAYSIQACFKKTSDVATIQLVGSASLTTIAEDSASWNVAIAVNVTDNTVEIKGTGEAGKTINWKAVINKVAIGG